MDGEGEGEDGEGEDGDVCWKYLGTAGEKGVVVLMHLLVGDLDLRVKKVHNEEVHNEEVHNEEV